MVLQSPLSIVTLDSSTPPSPQPNHDAPGRSNETSGSVAAPAHSSLGATLNWVDSLAASAPGPSYSRALPSGQASQRMRDTLFPGACSLEGLLSGPVWPTVGVPLFVLKDRTLYWTLVGKDRPSRAGSCLPWGSPPTVPTGHLGPHHLGSMARENWRPLDTLFLTSSTRCRRSWWQWHWRGARAARRLAASATSGTGHPRSPDRWRLATQELGMGGRLQNSRSPHSWRRWGASPGWTWDLSALDGEDQLGPPSHGEKEPDIHRTINTPTPEIHTLPELQ